VIQKLEVQVGLIFLYRSKPECHFAYCTLCVNCFKQVIKQIIKCFCFAIMTHCAVELFALVDWLLCSVLSIAIVL